MSMFQFYGIGAYLYGALTLSGLFVLGIVQGEFWASLTAVLSAGAAYFCQLAVADGDDSQHGLAAKFQILSITFGVAALLFLVM